LLPSLRVWPALHHFLFSFVRFRPALVKVVSDAMLVELKECFLEAYDDNQDGRIDIREVRPQSTRSSTGSSANAPTSHIFPLMSPTCANINEARTEKSHCSFQLAQLLPMEENFLLLFRFDNPLDSSVEFMKVISDACTFE